MRRATPLFALPLLLAALPALAGDSAVRRVAVDDLKAVIATVEPVRQILARARIGGVIAGLKVKEGDVVASGAEIAVVADQKLALQAQALAQRIRSQEAMRAQAKTDFDRVAELQRRGVSAQAQVDQARTQLDVADRTLSAMRADLKVIEQQTAEGAVLAPTAGRILSVPVSEGRPEIQGGRVVADVEAPSLGNYFVGERTRVYVPTGKRETIMIPTAALTARAGAWFVTLKDGASVVVQPGDQTGDQTEILSGLREGDVITVPEGAAK
jgi:multidrug efflux pump subunit AcrA (membrane-fusion protein)